MDERESACEIEKGALIGRILLVDDDPEWLDLAKRWLTEAGHEVIVQGDGTNLVAGARECRPDCIVLDFDLGGKAADLLCKELRVEADLNAVQIIGHTAHPEAKLRMLKQGADQFVAKTAQSGELLEIVQVCLRRKNLDSGVLVHQDLTLERERHGVRWQSTTVAVSEEQFDFLRLLVSRASQWIETREVAARLRRESRISERALIQLASRLRSVLPKPLGRRIRFSKKLGWIYQPDSAPSSAVRPK